MKIGDRYRCIKNDIWVQKGDVLTITEVPVGNSSGRCTMSGNINVFTIWAEWLDPNEPGCAVEKIEDWYPDVGNKYKARKNNYGFPEGEEIEIITSLPSDRSDMCRIQKASGGKMMGNLTPICVFDPTDSSYCFEKIENEPAKPPWHPEVGDKYKLIRSYLSLLSGTEICITDVEVTETENEIDFEVLGGEWKGQLGQAGMEFFDPSYEDYLLEKVNTSKPSPTDSINNHGRSTCIKCGKNTVELLLATSLSNRCPTCEKI